MKKIITLLLISITGFVGAQNFLGFQQSNYSGVMGTTVQPASFVDGRYKFDLNIVHQ